MGFLEMRGKMQIVQDGMQDRFGKCQRIMLNDLVFLISYRRRLIFCTVQDLESGYHEASRCVVQTLPTHTLVSVESFGMETWRLGLVCLLYNMRWMWCLEASSCLKGRRERRCGLASHWWLKTWLSACGETNSTSNLWSSCTFSVILQKSLVSRTTHHKIPPTDSHSGVIDTQCDADLLHHVQFIYFLN